MGVRAATTGSERRDTTPLQRKLTQSSAALLPPAAVLLAVAYSVLAVAHLLLVDAAIRTPLVISAALTAAFALLVYLTPALRDGRRVDAVLGILALLAWVNSVVHLSLDPEIRHTTNFAILLFGVGLMITRRRWFYPLLGLILGAWLWLVVTRSIVGAEHWVWMLSIVAGIAVVGHEQRRRLLRQDLEREDLLRRHAAELQKLVQSPELAGPNPKPVFDRIVTTAQRILGAERVGIWLLSAAEDRISLAAMTDERGPESEAFATQLDRDAAPVYFEALLEARSLAIDDAMTDPRTRELVEPYLLPLGVNALLDTPIQTGGRCAGVLCVEHRGEGRAWSLEEQSFAASLADFAAVSLQALERAELEQRTQTAERLESLGLLAGGVAHDFNNLLTAVIGNAELVLMSTELVGPERAEIERIVEAAQQAADLSRQMLTYSGRGSIEPRAVDLNRITSEYRNSRSIAPIEATIEVVTTEPLPAARADPVQVVQILRNLISNAADAGAERIVLRTGVVELDAAALAPLIGTDAAEPGRFVYLETEDDGSGMDSETARLVFDPFFTTKRLGQGLGLAAALGTMRMHGGAIELETAQGAGARFRFLFPVAAEATPAPRDGAPGMESDPARRRALVVDDEPLVLDLISRTLESAGRVVEGVATRSDFERGLVTLAADDLELAVIDLTLPDGSGVEIARVLRERAPGLPIVLVSGFDEHGGLAEMLLEPGIEFLLKPFGPRQLLEAIARCEVGRVDA